MTRPCARTAPLEHTERALTAGADGGVPVPPDNGDALFPDYGFRVLWHRPSAYGAGCGNVFPISKREFHICRVVD